IDPSAVQRVYATTLRRQPSAAAVQPSANVTPSGTAQIAPASPAAATPAPSPIVALSEAINPGGAQGAHQVAASSQPASPSTSAAPQPASPQPSADQRTYASDSENSEPIGREPGCQGVMIAGRCYQVHITGPDADRLVTQLRTSDADQNHAPSPV